MDPDADRSAFIRSVSNLGRTGRIVLSLGAGSGKTITINQLKARGFNVIDEAALQVINELLHCTEVLKMS